MDKNFTLEDLRSAYEAGRTDCGHEEGYGGDYYGSFEIFVEREHPNFTTTAWEIRYRTLADPSRMKIARYQAANLPRAKMLFKDDQPKMTIDELEFFQIKELGVTIKDDQRR